MNKNTPGILFCTLVLFTGPVFPQTPPSRLERGIALYGESRWREAVMELRRAEAGAQSAGERCGALYWISLAELGAGEYEAALADMEEMERFGSEAPEQYTPELPYHKGRALFYLGRYDEAIVLLRDYLDKAGDPVKEAAALYWIGECLFTMGQMDRARDIFIRITEQYPQSVKYEASAYRLALINQKKIESELLELLKWSHEESLRTVEDYQRRERVYDQALIAYQKRLSDLSRIAGDESGEEYQRQLSAAERRIGELEALLREAAIPLPPARQDEAGRNSRLLELRNSALETRNGLLRTRNGEEDRSADPALDAGGGS